MAPFCNRKDLQQAERAGTFSLLWPFHLVFQPVGSGCNYLRFRGSPVAQAQVCYLGAGEMARSSFPELVSQTFQLLFTPRMVAASAAMWSVLLRTLCKVGSMQ